ncbi:hypothetical protein [Sphingosinicella humi]|uniref:Circumsporozoite protein n=1 Tax=Allosphingosinicella humi TaxID=2068657 RepID=A0A2U2J3E8_9SPHN|nr:hypothetical protein [Sphingosinicella humi]PWG02860.1 hypothetical protein DF286_08245 [Sphingosinicella humi]
MKRLSIAILGAGLVALGACSGASEETAVDNAATDTLAVPEDETLAPVDDTLGDEVNAIGDEVNALDAGNATEANAADASVESNRQ